MKDLNERFRPSLVATPSGSYHYSSVVGATPEPNGSSALPIKVKSKQLDYYFVVVQVMHVV